MNRQTFLRAAADTGIIIAGTALVALGLVIFTIPNRIAPGGVSGLATALAHITPLHVSLWTLLLNVPLMLLALLRLGIAPLSKTLFSTVLLSGFLELFERWVPGYTSNVLLSAVLGGVLIGAGTGLLLLRNTTTGGTDLLSLLLNRRFPGISVGKLLLGIDVGVVIFAVIVFRDIDVALYSIVTIWVSTKVIDTITAGADYAKVMYIVTEKGAEINRALAENLEMGVTIWEAKGGYTDRRKNVLTLVLHRSQFSSALGAVKAIDRNAFVYICGATEVHGEGFKPLR